MLESITFKNFRALRDCTLPLSRVTILVGPNSAGKSSALRGIHLLGSPQDFRWEEDRTVDELDREPTVIEGVREIYETRFQISKVWEPTLLTALGSAGTFSQNHKTIRLSGSWDEQFAELGLGGFRSFDFQQSRIIEPSQLTPKPVLASDGFGLATVLDQMRDKFPERFRELNEELGQWLPEFDQIQFYVPDNGLRAFSLRLRNSQKSIPATSLSTGTLFIVALLTVAFDYDGLMPIVALEEPDKAIHPRLLVRVREAIYRMAFPKEFGSDRTPIQVVATTHSPYFLDLFKDHPEEVVIADKTEAGIKFKRLSDRPNGQEILPDGALGELWYSGILGGVPVGT